VVVVVVRSAVGTGDKRRPYVTRSAESGPTTRGSLRERRPSWTCDADDGMGRHEEGKRPRKRTNDAQHRSATPLITPPPTRLRRLIAR
jgi:hypothetical protein